jgi:uncharacterized protein YndB with AHSA1/START domain
LSLHKSVAIQAGRDQVWDTLTNPAKNSRLFDGTQIVTDWKAGSPILFRGVFQGQAYQDKGHVLVIEPSKVLQYNYWTGFTWLADKPENYSLVTYTLAGEGTHTSLTLSRVGFAHEQEYQHALAGWEMVMQKIKAITEAA